MKKGFRKCTGKLTVLLSMLSVLVTLVPAGFAQAEDTITVDEAIAKHHDGTQATVEGYIVGYVKSEQNVTRENFTDDTNVAIAVDLEETDTDKMLYVQIPQAFRSEFGLRSNAGLLGESVVVSGNLEPYFRTNGLKDTSNVTLSGEGMERKTTEKVNNANDANDAGESVQIHDIQGNRHQSPLEGQHVTDVEGIVTYKYDISGSNYLHIQSPEDDYDGDLRTSEGIVVYTGKEEKTSIGDFVHVSGIVNEYYIDGYNDKSDTDLPVTQINARSDKGGNIDILDHNVALPEPIKVTSTDIPDKVISENGFDDFDPEAYAIDFWESMAGMRVEIDKSKAIAPQENGCLAVVTDEFETDTNNGGIRLEKGEPNTHSILFRLHPNGMEENFAVKTGDQLIEPVTGVVHYGFSNYQVYTDLNEVEDVLKEGGTTSKTTDIVKDEDKLTVASYNVENFSANTNETSDKKAANIARSFVEDMNSPDIVGVIEMQDNNGQKQGPEGADASESYKRLLHEIQKENGPVYDYVNINPNYNKDGGEPGGNIRVGFLYNPDRVTLTDGVAGTAGEAVDYEDESLTLNPGRISPGASAFEGTRKSLAAQFEFHGESIVVVANHLIAQLGDDPVFGRKQPPDPVSEGKRIEQADIINGFVHDIQAKNPNENVIVLGDLNDAEFSSAVETLQGEQLMNLVEKEPKDTRYSFIYQGSSRVIDHILVSHHLADEAEIDLLHINSDFTEMHGRASDHDPVLAQLDLNTNDEVSAKFPGNITNINLFLMVGAVLFVFTWGMFLFRRRSRRG